MKFIEAEKFDEEAKESIKYFPDELVAMLSEENRRIYDSWTHTEYKEINMFSKYDFEKMFPVLEEMQSHIRGIIPNETMNMYVKAVINQIMLERNKIVAAGTYNRTVQEQLENLTKCLNMLVSYKGKSKDFDGRKVDIIGEETLYDEKGNIFRVDYYKKIEEMQKMLENDKIRYPIYVEYLDQKSKKVCEKYYELKSEYDKKSKIGKFIARLTGKERELEDAKRKYDYAYDRGEVAIQSQGDKVSRHQGEWIQVENGAIVTPAEYEERLRLLEEEKNGRSR